MSKIFIALVIITVLISASHQNPENSILLSDDYSGLSRGPFNSEVGAHMEYHYVPEGKPRGNWAISSFRSNLPASWYVREINGKKTLWQKGVNPNNHWHPIMVAGDELWQNYTIKTSFGLLENEKQSGIVFRYQNDRCYYFVGVKQNVAYLKMVKHATAFHKPFEKELASQPFEYKVGEDINVTIEVNGNHIVASFENGPSFEAIDDTYDQGKVGFLADGPAYFGAIEVSSSAQDKTKFESHRAETNREEQSLRDKNPKPVLWKSIKTKDFGVGRNLRFGDLTKDGTIDVLIGQVVHHGPKDRNSELSCLTAMTFDGEKLWQIGKPDPWKNNLTSDVAFQIHDLDNDGVNEVIYCMNQKLIVADASTGKTKYEIPTPLTPGGKPTSGGQNIFERILGDCLYFCDLQGQGYDGDIILKDRYAYVWAFDSKLKLLWKSECNTGHYPYAYDVDKDGKDELMMGYTLFDDNGDKLWSLDKTISDHADGVAIVKFNSDEEPRLLCAASDEGMFFADMSGNVTNHYYIGHVQNPAIANFRDDKPGLESVSVNYWGNQGIIHLYDSDNKIYHEFEPNQYGSMCLPLNWTGKSEEFYLLNTNVDIGGAYDGRGRKVLDFPDDGHPDMCNAVMDITGDSRDEIVTWDPNEIWVYTQDDSPKSGKLYKPKRNPLYNYSNYQTSVSLPGWNE